ncbi:MAG TPA: cupin domain-containing protein [Chryseolinea sp.]|nr:cupin domain-containing protein [Chryseolinea sp.]
MPVQKYDQTLPSLVKNGVSRRLIHTNNLMTVIIDFSNGPWNAPDPLHSHPHEQTTYIAEGEVLFICEGEIDQKLSVGDMFYVASNKKHAIQLLSTKARLVDSFNPIRKDFLE